MLEVFSENVIQSIVIAQDLARLENSEFVEFNHILEGLSLNKRSSAGYILNKLKIQEKKIYVEHLFKSIPFYEVQFSKSSKNILKKAIEDSRKILGSQTPVRSIFVLKVIILDKSHQFNHYSIDFDKKINNLLEEIKIFEECVPDLPRNKISLPPNDIVSEKIVLGSILYYSEIIDKLSGKLKPEYFFSHKHQDIFKAALLLNSHNKRINLLEISNLLSQKGLLGKIGGDLYLIDLVECLPGKIPLDKQIKSIKKNYFKRCKRYCT